MIKADVPPYLIGNISIPIEEMMLYMYLPIKMAGSKDIRVPDNLKVFMPIIGQFSYLEENYIYLTVKNRWATKENPNNRPGWHIDGYLTNDINIIWCNRYPTVFTRQSLLLPEDHKESIKVMEANLLPEHEYTFGPNDLLRLTPQTMHRAPTIETPGMRCFFKLSSSKHKYNLKGNSHNYLFDYKWNMYDRGVDRNCPIVKEPQYE